MGYELWTSPITGYRRRGTRLAELRALLASGITAHAILEPLRWCPADAPSADIQSALRQKGFDVAGVLQDERGLLLARRTKGRVTFRRSLLQPSGSPRMTLRRRANASRYVILLSHAPGLNTKPAHPEIKNATSAHRRNSVRVLKFYGPAQDQVVHEMELVLHDLDTVQIMAVQAWFPRADEI